MGVGEEDAGGVNELRGDFLSGHSVFMAASLCHSLLPHTIGQLLIES